MKIENAVDTSLFQINPSQKFEEICGDIHGAKCARNSNEESGSNIHIVFHKVGKGYKCCAILEQKL